ncbi:MAG: peptidoglycan-binding protein [Leptolyngbyaceae cyanobacterium bins.59]|nr:peptidoglycan-binding protein [Leptolyngbyaceae cyanobacterium bins.59]
MSKVFYEQASHLVQQDPERYKSLGSLSQKEAQQLAKTIFGDGPGAELLIALDQQYSNGTGTLIKRQIALARHEGQLRFGRENLDPASGYNFGTYQIGGLDTNRSDSLKKYNKNLEVGLQIYTSLTGKKLDLSALSQADKDAMCHVGYIYSERQRSYNGDYYKYDPGRPKGDIFRDLGNPSLPQNQAIELMSSGIQGGIRAIGEDVARMQKQLVVDVEKVNEASQNKQMLRQGVVSEHAVGADVKEIQTALNKNGFSLQVTGQFDAQTKQAVVQFQTSKGLIPDGVVGPDTWNKLLPQKTQQASTSQEQKPPQTASTAKAATNAQANTVQPVQSGLKNLVQVAQAAMQQPTLRMGDRGEPVKQLQQRLNQSGITIATDGIFGPETRQGVITYQARHGLQTDGIVGPQTWSSLQSTLQKQANQAPPQQSTQNASIKLESLAVPPGNTYYGAPRPDGRKHAGVDTYSPNKNVDTEAPQATLGGKIVKVGYEPNGYGHYVDIYNEKLKMVERIAEFTTPKFTQADVGKTIPSGTVVGIGAHQTTIIHREFRPYETYQKGGYHQYGFEGTVNWQETVKGLGLYRQEGNNLVPTGRVISQQVGATQNSSQPAQKAAQQASAEQTSVESVATATLNDSSVVQQQVEADRAALEQILAASPNLEGGSQEAVATQAQNHTTSQTAEQTSEVELG